MHIQQQNLWCTAKAGLRGKFITLNIRRKKGLILSFYLKNIEKEGYIFFQGK